MSWWKRWHRRKQIGRLLRGPLSVFSPKRKDVETLVIHVDVTRALLDDALDPQYISDIIANDARRAIQRSVYERIAAV